MVLVIMLMAFVMIIGLGVVAVAGSSSGQTSVNLSQRQADLTAKSVLDAVVAKVQAQSNPIDPVAYAANDTKIVGSNDKMGGWIGEIAVYNSSLNQYKISVEAYFPNSSGAHSKMNRIIQGTLKQSGPSFNVIGQSTGLPSVALDSLNGNIDGSLLLNEAGKTLQLSSGAKITGSLQTKGSLNISNYDIGTAGKNNVLQAEGNITITGTGNGGIFADVTSGGNIDIRSLNSLTNFGNITAYGSASLGSFNASGSVYANSSVNVTNYVNVSGDINSANSTVTVAGGSCQNINAQGAVTLGYGAPTVNGNINTNSGGCTINSGTVKGNINSVGDVVIYSGTVNNVCTNGNVTISGGTINGNIYALGTVTINNSQAINGSIYTNGNIIINGGTLKNIYAYGNVTINNWSNLNGTVNLNGTLYNSIGMNLTGKVFYGTVTKIASPQVSAVQIQAVTKVTVNTETTSTFNSIKAQIDAQRSSMASSVFAIDLTSKTSLANCYTYSNGKYIINKNCTFSIKPYAINWQTGPAIVLDATSQDIYVTLKSNDGSNNFKLGDGICILSRDTSGLHHKVYLCMDDGNGNYMNFSITNNQYNGVFLGNENYILNQTDETPNLYMVSTYQPAGSQPQQTISFAGSTASTLYGYIYAPYASINMSVNATYMNNNFPAALIGAVVGSNISFNMLKSNIYTYQYKDPNGGGNGSGSGTGSGTLSWLGTDCKVIGTYVGN